MPPVKLEQDTDTDAGAGADNRIVTRNRVCHIEQYCLRILVLDVGLIK
jgi:hypothetical protein